MSLRKIGFVLAAIGFGLATAPHHALAVTTCCVHGTTPCFAGNITEANCPGGNICGCTIDNSTNCTLTLSANATTSAASDCLTIGSGVTFDMNGKSITCTGTNCGKAVHNTASGSGSNKVLVESGTISGCFDAGIYMDASGGSNTNSAVSDMTVDMGSGCANGNGIAFSNGDFFSIGIFAPHGVVARAIVKNAYIGIYGTTGSTNTDVEDSILENNVNGMTNAAGSIDNVLFLNNTYHLWEFKGSWSPDISGSSFAGVGTCDCATTPSGASNAESCQSGITDCGTIQAPPSHVCDGSSCSVVQ